MPRPKPSYSSKSAPSRGPSRPPAPYGGNKAVAPPRRTWERDRRDAPVEEKVPTKYLSDFPFFAITVEGVEPIAEEEIRELHRRTQMGPAAPSLLTFDAEVHPEDLLKLKCVEDVFATLSIIQPFDSESGVQQVFRAVNKSPLWDDALELHRFAQPSKKSKPTYRIVSQLSGMHEFRRVDLKKAVSDAIEQRTRKGWKEVDEGGAIEVWVRGEEEIAVVGVRLSDATMRHRTYKETQLPASLKPSVAAAMIRLTRPSAEEVFLDPMCGSGTLLIERANAGRYALIRGGDADPLAVEATLANIGMRYQPIQIQPMDARHLPLETASVDKLATNLPFGKQISNPEALPGLYRSAFAEFGRVVKPGGRAVLLVSREGEWRETLKTRKEWKLRKQHRIRLLGLRPTIIVLDRQD